MHRLEFYLTLACLVAGPGSGATLAEEHPVSLPLVAAPTASPTDESIEVRVDWGTAQDFEITLPATIQIRAPEEGPGSLHILSESWWTPEEPLTLKEPGALLPPRTVFPATFLEGEVEAPRGSALPELIHLGLYRPDSWEETHWTIPCPLSAQRTFRCKVPAGVFDVRLRVEGFASEYRWGLPLPQGKQADLGTLPLKPGSSISGWLQTGDGTPFDGSTRVTAENSILAEGNTLDQRLKVQSREATITEKGFFQITSLGPGGYRLRVSQQGFADQEVPGVTLIPGHESILLEPVTLERPLEFRLRLSPPLDPRGKPWKVRLARTRSTRSTTGEADPQGEWSLPGLSAGEYWLQVSTHRGERWHSEFFELFAWNATKDLELSKIAIHGILTLGGSPVEAVLWFGGSSGAERVDRYSDSEGHFRGFLPHAGEWPLEVELPSFGDQTLDAEEVLVEPDPDTGVAELRIDLSALEIRGRVVNATGEPVEGARVQGQIGGTERFVSQKVDPDGRFHLVGLPEGVVILKAKVDQKSSNSHPVELTEGAALQEVTLTLERHRQVAVRVVSPYGPVPRAELLVYPQTGERIRSLVGGSTQQADLDGVARFVVPEDTTSLMVTALAPGFAARIVRLPAPQEGIVDVEVHQTSGTVRIDTATEPRTPIGYLRLVTSEGWVSLLALQQYWVATGRKGELVLYNLEPGEYALCPIDSRLKTCDTGYLAPLGELELRVPVQSAGTNAPTGGR